MDKSTKVIHPLLFAVFPVIFLYSHNIGEVRLLQALVPFTFCLTGGALLWCIIIALLKNKYKAAIISSLTIIYFFSYGHAFETIKGAYIGNFKIGIHTYILPIWTLFFGLPALWALMSKKKLFNLTKILNVTSICLVFLSLSNVVVFHSKSFLISNIDNIPVTDGKKGEFDSRLKYKPNIYYIILDEYARADILKDELGYDNTPFISHLKDKGFYVSENSRSNYMQTMLSIPSSTNFKYLDDLAKTYGSDSVDKRPLGQILRNNMVFGFLKNYGYTTIAFSTGYDITEATNADHYLSGVFTTNSFINELLNSTPVMSLKKFSKSVHLAHYNRLNYTFDKLAKTAKITSPHIVFAHIVCPHTPYVFDENGEFTGQTGTFRLDKNDFDPDVQKTMYLAQLKYVNKRITKAIDEILANSDQKPVIIIQSDHGIRWNLGKTPDTGRNKDIHYAIINALHLPGFDYSRLDNNITPVNTFRFIFNNYFGTEFEIFDNKNYHSALPHIYKFRDATEQLNQE